MSAPIGLKPPTPIPPESIVKPTPPLPRYEKEFMMPPAIILPLVLLLVGLLLL